MHENEVTRPPMRAKGHEACFACFVNGLNRQVGLRDGGFLTGEMGSAL